MRPGFCREVCIPPRYETVTEEVCVTPGRWEWRRNTECEVPEPVADPTVLAEVIAHEVPLALGHTDLGQAFAALDPDLQAVLAATALDGLTNAEAATLLGIPTGTVKSRLARAREIVKEQLR